MARKTKNNDQDAYYTLRAVHATSGSAHNRQLMAGADTIHIGQTADCEWHFDNTTNYIDEIYAVIRPGQISGEWVLVPTSEHVSVSVNGTKVDLIHYLRDGDIIGFDGERQELRFNVHHDGRYSADIGVAYIPVRLSKATMLCMFIAVALVIGAVWLLVERANQRTENISKKLNAIGATDVFSIKVDTIYFIADAIDADGIMRADTINRYAYSPTDGGVISGTAFIVNDSLLVTARHCIQPWLNDPSINKATCPNDLPPGPVRWAFEAETNKQLNGSDSLRVVSLCTIWGGESGTTFIARYTSDEFSIDSLRDDIVQLGDFNNTCFWRSIERRGELKTQMLDDVAFVTLKRDKKSTLTLATDEYVANMERGQKLYYLGFPNYDENSYAYTEGTLQKDYEQDEMLSHGGYIGHGYSGGPVVVIDENMRVIVVGIISVADSKGIGRAYSVPVTEIKTK